MLVISWSAISSFVTTVIDWGTSLSGVGVRVALLIDGIL